MIPVMENSRTALYWHALHARVLVVAVAHADVGDWEAYTTPVPGMNHEQEVRRWRQDGEKIDERIANLLFPLLAEDERFRWRP